MLQAIEAMIPECNYPFKAGAKLYRARIFDESDPGKLYYSKTEMGIAPKSKAIGGRINPDGIPCFYLASDIGTAIAEVRPWKEAKVFVASFEVTEDINCFLLNQYINNHKNEKMTRYYAFSLLISAQFAMPINPSKRVEYLPTQYLAEFIKSKGFEGIIYRSVLGNGVNFVFFSDNKLKINNDIRQYIIKNVSYDFEEEEYLSELAKKWLLY